MATDVFQQIYNLLADEDTLVEFANSEGGEVIPKGDIRVAQNAAALASAFGNALRITFDRVGEAREETFLAHLDNLAENGGANYIFSDGPSTRLLAHLTWLTSQFFRGPEFIARIAKHNFTALTQDQLDIDTVHLKRAAAFLRAKLQQHQDAAAA